MEMNHRRLQNGGSSVSAVRLAQVKAAMRERSRRAIFLPSELLGEPAWDILLELYFSEIMSDPVTEAEIAGRTNAPIATSIRWMNVLEGMGLIARSPAPEESTEIRISLTAKGSAAMDSYFSSAA